jgi:hypothetical protein
MSEIFKFYEKRLYDNFRLDLFIKNEKILLYKMGQFKVFKLAGGQMNTWMDGGKTWFKGALRSPTI